MDAPNLEEKYKKLAAEYSKVIEGFLFVEKNLNKKFHKFSIDSKTKLVESAGWCIETCRT